MSLIDGEKLTSKQPAPAHHSMNVMASAFESFAPISMGQVYSHEFQVVEDVRQQAASGDS